MNADDIDPEGFQRGGPSCVCGSLYSYGGHVEPGQYAPDCPEHGDPDFYLVGRVSAEGDQL